MAYLNHTTIDYTDTHTHEGKKGVGYEGRGGRGEDQKGGRREVWKDGTNWIWQKIKVGEGGIK